MQKEDFRGAESKLFRGQWLGKSVVFKKRFPKNYRIKELDYYFRKQRTIHEAKLLSRAKSAGVKTPFIFEIDIANTMIIMEAIKGEILKIALDKLTLEEQKNTCFKMGEDVGRLHANGIVHGDLTTSNVILTDKTKELIFIDFGLGHISDRLEDFGIDLYLLERAFISTHPNLFDVLWKEVLKGYKVTSPYGKDIESKITEITSRGRYSDRV